MKIVYKLKEFLSESVAVSTLPTLHQFFITCQKEIFAGTLINYC